MKINELKTKAHENALRRGAYDCPDCGGDGKSYGMAPHSHDLSNGFIGSTRLDDQSKLPDNFIPDEESIDENGVYHQGIWICKTCNGTGKTPAKNIIEKLREEVEEFAEDVENKNIAVDLNDVINLLKNDCTWNKTFIFEFEKRIKNTIGDELADIILVALAAAEELNIDIESHLISKNIFNSLRDD